MCFLLRSCRSVVLQFANFPTDLQDGNRSRSPARYSSRGRSQGGRREEPGAAGGSYSNQHAHPHERGRSQRWEQQGHYDSGMYDDGYYGRDQDYVDDRQYEASGQRGRRDSISREPTGRRGSTQSRSRSRDAGKPTDTVILEKLPDGISQSEVSNPTIGSENQRSIQH